MIIVDKQNVVGVAFLGKNIYIDIYRNHMICYFSIKDYLTATHGVTSLEYLEKKSYDFFNFIK
jgi:hypothetical protein